MKTRKLPCKLTDSEIIERTSKLSSLIRDRSIKTEEKRMEAAHMKNQIDALNDQIEVLALVLYHRQEEREVEITEEKNFASGIADIIRTDTGEVVESRRMHPSEMQVAIPLRIKRNVF